MKKTLKRFLCTLLAVLFIVGLTVATNAYQKDGWYKDAGGWYYIDGGVRARNLFIDDAKGTCCVGDDGYMVYNSWRVGTGYLNKDLEYYIDGNGYMVKNRWSKINGDWYYFGGDGVLAKNKWIQDSAGWCHVDEDGIMDYDTIVRDSAGLCLVDKNGRWVTKKGWYQVWSNTDWVYVDANSRLKTNSWMNDSAGWCYLGSYGIMFTDTAVRDSKGLCLVDNNGRWVTKKGWYTMNDGYDWVYVDANQRLRTHSWMNDSHGWCYLNDDGIMETNAIVEDSHGLCYVNYQGYWDREEGSWLAPVWEYNYNNGEYELNDVDIYIESDGYLSRNEYQYYPVPHMAEDAEGGVMVYCGARYYDNRGHGSFDEDASGYYFFTFEEYYAMLEA